MQEQKDYILKAMLKNKETNISYFNNLPSLLEIQEATREYIDTPHEDMKGYGDNRYYKLHHKDNLLGTLDKQGDFVENIEFMDYIIKFYLQNDSQKSKNAKKLEMQMLLKYGDLYVEFYKYVKEIVNKFDPFGIAWVDENEYEPEFRDLCIKLMQKRNLDKSQILKITKAVFEDWFYVKEENEELYKNMANELYDFYISKQKNILKGDS